MPSPSTGPSDAERPDVPLVLPVVLPSDEAAASADDSAPTETVEHPAKVMRIASMIRQLLDEVRQAPLDEASRNRLREIYRTSVEELSEGLSQDLRDELGRVSLVFDAAITPSEAELRIAQAQLVGWLEGLFHGIQATMFAQQVAARSQMEEAARRGLPSPGPGPGPGPGPDLRPPGYL